MSFELDTAVDLGEKAGVNPGDDLDAARDKLRERFREDTLSDDAVDTLADILADKLDDDDDSVGFDPGDVDSDATFDPDSGEWR